MGGGRGFNIKFFHSTVKRRLKKNHIAGIVGEGKWLNNPSYVKRAFHDHFASFFQ